ncbi:hypothetical protein McpSp1_10670 [Methanocorpusculaceae archaeon Sp1]|nr:hypothetical protein [Methanocorpusculaceae archaeon Sp1]
MKPKNPEIHTPDYLAWRKFATGDWIADIAAGEIINRRTGKPVPFSKNPNGYLIVSVRIGGMQTGILKHRAIWVAAHGILGLPLDYTLQIDHINHDKTDCRLENLRLVTAQENNRSKPGRIPDAIVDAIRSRYVAKHVTCRQLAAEYGVSPGTVSRIARTNPGGA